MPLTYSNNLRLTLIGNGEQSGTWGDLTNNNLGTLIEQAISGYTTVSMLDATYTLTTLSGAVDEARSMALNITSSVTLTATRNVIVPTTGSPPTLAPYTKLYVVRNATTGGQSIVIKTSAGSGVTIGNGTTAIVLCDGTNVIDPISGKVSTTGATMTGGLTFSGSGTRIQGDFSNATVGNRTFFQDKTTNNATSVGAIPNGTGVESSVAAFGVSDSANSTYLTIASGSNYTKLESGKTGTASYAPLTFNVGGAEAAQFNTSGNFVITKSGARIQGDFSTATFANRTAFQDKTTNSGTSIYALPNGTATESGWNAWNKSDPTNGGYVGLSISSTEAALYTSKTGTGGYVPLLIYAGGTEAARFGTNGQFLVGTTNGSSTAGSGIKMTPDSAAPWVATVGSDNTGTNASYYLYSSSAAAYRFYVTYSGTVHAVSTTITAISDARLKENIRDLDAGLTEIMALQPRRFDWKPGKGKDKKDDWGWIAQEFEQTFPEMIQDWKDPAPEGEEPYKAVNADLIPILVKAMQEQQALIVSLEARVSALEAA